MIGFLLHIVVGLTLYAIFRQMKLVPWLVLVLILTIGFTKELVDWAFFNQTDIVDSLLDIAITCIFPVPLAVEESRDSLD